jgi:class 3 adenylate cyclase
MDYTIIGAEANLAARLQSIAEPGQIVDIAAPLGIAVHDHIIVGKDGHATLRGLKLM